MPNNALAKELADILADTHRRLNRIDAQNAQCRSNMERVCTLLKEVAIRPEVGLGSDTQLYAMAPKPDT